MGFKNLKFLTLFLLFFSVFSFVSAIKPIIEIDEDISVTYLGSNSRASVEANGILKITNPSLVESIYEINIPLSLDALIGFSNGDTYFYDIVNGSEQRFIEGSGFNFEFNRIRKNLLAPNKTVYVDYKIYGLVDYDIKAETIDKNLTFLQYYSEDIQLISNAVLNVQKANREKGRAFGNSANYTYEVGFENVSDRLVSVDVKNPTGFDYQVNKVNIYRTQSSDPIFGSDDIIKIYTNISLNPYETKTYDFLDEDSTDFSVYWVSSEILIQSVLSSNFSYTQRTQSSGGSSGGSGGGGFYFDDDQTHLIVKKSVDKSLISAGEEFTVTIRVVNLLNKKLENLELFDEIPVNHEIKDVTKGVKIEDGTNLKFDIEELDEYSEFVVQYTLSNKNSVQGVTYLKPSTVKYKTKEYFSDGVILISDLLPDKKVFVQKKVESYDEEFAKITITVKNLGGELLEDLLISDNIDQNAIIREISQVFEQRGVWNIKSLKPGQEWKVSYLIERNSKIENLPNLFGVDQDKVFQTLIFTEEVVTVFEEDPRTIERVGMVVAVGLLVLYLLF